MSSAHPHLDELTRKKRHKSTMNFVLLGAMALAFLIALTYIVLNAGKWGVPMFGFTNEHGSPCKNGFLGHTCTPMTLADVEARSQVDLPDDTQVLQGTWTKTHDFTLDARVVFPAASAAAARETLGEAFGECKPGVPNPLTQIPGVQDVCTMSNIGRISTDGRKPDPRIWQVSTGTQPDGTVVSNLSIRSR